MDVGLEESLKIMSRIYGLAVERMKRGVEVHGTKMIRKPFEELEEELADAFNYICMGYIKTIKACGGYKDIWNPKKLPDVQRREMNDTETLKTKRRVQVSRPRSKRP